MKKLDRYPFQIRLTVYLLLTIIIIYSAIVARHYLWPIIMAALISYLLFPVADLLEKWKFPRILAILLSIVLAIAVISGIVVFVTKQVQFFLEDLPQMRTQAISNYQRLENFINSKTGIEPNLTERLSEIGQLSGNFIANAFTATTGTFARIILLPVFIFLMLFYRTKFHEFLLRLVPESSHYKTNKITLEVSHVAKNYLGGVLIVVTILAITNSTGLIIIGIEHAILFGVLSAIMNFIPYFGTLLGAAFPLIYVLTTYEDLTYAPKILLLFIFIQFLENNILTPNITGGKVDLNPFVTILAIFGAGLLWGVLGMFLIIPLLGIFKIICEHIESLKPYAYLLGTDGARQHSISLKNIKQFFIKLINRSKEDKN
jgi:predicted PurR-regulated permease PerM